MHKYEIAFNHIRDMIDRGVLKPGSKIPSIRKLSQQLGLSAITIQHSYDLLQAQGVIDAQPKSGFFVPEPQACKRSELLRKSSENVVRQEARPVTVADLTYSTLSHWGRRELGGFGGVNPHPDLLGFCEADRYLRLASRRGNARRDAFDPPEGNLRLREGIARNLSERGLVVAPSDVVITGNGMQGFELCLDILTEAGDTVLIDAPTYLPIIAALKRKGLKVLEIYSHPLHGVDPDQLSHLLSNYCVKAILLSPINHFPTGASSSKDAMKKLACILEQHRIPLLEVDIFGELCHSQLPHSPLMSYCSNQEVLLFGSLFHTVGPDYGVGWVVTRNRTKEIVQQKYVNNLIFSGGLLQLALSEYIAERQYEKDLKKLRAQMLSRTDRGISLLKHVLPGGFRLSVPSGGYMCWIRGPSNFDAIRAATLALDLQLSLAAGPMFSPTDGFANFVGVNLSNPWVNGSPESLESIVAILEQ